MGAGRVSSLVQSTSCHFSRLPNKGRLPHSVYPPWRAGSGRTLPWDTVLHSVVFVQASMGFETLCSYPSNHGATELYKNLPWALYHTSVRTPSQVFSACQATEDQRVWQLVQARLAWVVLPNACYPAGWLCSGARLDL